jgi:hypothetical protein
VANSEQIVHPELRILVLGSLIVKPASDVTNAPRFQSRDQIPFNDQMLVTDCQLQPLDGPASADSLHLARLEG